MAKKKPVEDQTEQDAAPDESVVWASNLRELGEVDPRDLIAHPLNPKIHTELQREAIGAALGRIGWVLPIIVNRTTGRIIDGHGRVEEAAVVAVPDEEAGVRITAFLSCKEGAPPSLIEMKRFCSEHLPLYMIPDRFTWLEGLPKTSTDKIDYQRLKDMS